FAHALCTSRTSAALIGGTNSGGSDGVPGSESGAGVVDFSGAGGEFSGGESILGESGVVGVGSGTVSGVEGVSASFGGSTGAGAGSIGSSGGFGVRDASGLIRPARCKPKAIAASRIKLR